MGATLSSHGLADEHLRSLVTEYTTQSLKTVEECWQIFVDEAHSARSLTYVQFDEVFGMLLQDTLPHYAVPTVHTINNLTFIESTTKLLIYRDCVNAVTRMLRLSEPPSTEITNAMEVYIEYLYTLTTDDTKPLVTLKEAIEYSLTQPFVCSFFEELQSLFTGLVTEDKAMTFFQNSELLEDASAATFFVADCTNDPDVLWSTKIRDVGGQTLYNDDMFHMPDDVQCFLALKELQLRRRRVALVYEHHRVGKAGDRVYSGLVDYETFARCLLAVLPPLEVNCKSTGSYMVNMSKLPDIELVKMEGQIADAGRKFAAMSLREVLQLARDSNEFVPSGQPTGLRVSYADDYLFNLVHRFATCTHLLNVVTTHRDE
ncbi:hypothetical protein DYB35_003838 [Aphanomyces astaci]|uniref:Uncharacterized protein n=1 Tax=Aphanomyces astaci TaxID=112090 RepID=A0A3R6WIR5_APHAT|nr:hypothetical protein DYB35_003838 [Aphanomyces astaci]